MPRSTIGLTTKVMLAEITRRRATLRKLQNRRKALMAQLANVESMIVAAGGSLLRGRGLRSGVRRPQNRMKLSEAMVQAMRSDKAMSVHEIAGHVRKAGYVSNSPSFKTIICQTLAREKQFKRVSRGMYMLKS